MPLSQPTIVAISIVFSLLFTTFWQLFCLQLYLWITGDPTRAFVIVYKPSNTNRLQVRI